MTDQLIDGRVIPYPNGRRENDSRLWRDATDLELEQAARIEELERHIEELEARADDLTDAYMSGYKDGRDQAEKTKYDKEFTDEIKALAEEAGFVTWNGERWNIDNNVVDWAGPYDDELVKFYHLVKGTK